MDDPIVLFGTDLIPLSRAHVSPEDRGFLFADGVYESVRHYPTGTGIGVLFEAEQHRDRLAGSLEAIRLDGVDVHAIFDALPELVARNHLTDAHASVYVQVTRGTAPRTHVFPDASTPPTIYARARRFAPLDDGWRDGVAVASIQDMRWGRCDVKSIALLPNVLASEDARRRGAWEAVFVRDGVITEGSHTAVAAVVDGRVRIHPPGPQVLPSVTLEVVLGLCADLGLEVDRRAIAADELDALDEMFLMGTTTEIMPVVRVDDRPVGDGSVGPVTRRVQSAYFALHP